MDSSTSIPALKPELPAAPAVGKQECLSNTTPGETQAGSGVKPAPGETDPRAPAVAHRTCRDWVRYEGAGRGARLRGSLVLGLIILLYVGLSFRLVQIQVTQKATWEQKRNSQEIASEKVPAPRGQLLDKQGLPMAYCLPRDTVLADLKLLFDKLDKKDPDFTAKTAKARADVAKSLSPLINVPEQTLCEKLSPHDEKQRVVYLARNVDSSTIEKVRALKIRGIAFEDEYRRTYPQGNLMCHVMGFAGLDGGMEGIEMELDSILSGTPGYLQYYRDAAHRMIALNDGAIGPAENHPPRDGLTVTLTLDARVQQTAEEQLALIKSEFDPKAATCVVMDVGTGAILAMACIPQFDPNQPSKSPPENRRNRIITDFYEPGSTFKVFGAAACLERKLWHRHDMIDCENGAWNLGYRTIHDSHAYGLLSFEDVIAKSSNIGAAKFTTRLGIDNFYNLIRVFGFGHITGVNLPGESKGKVRARKVWTQDSLYSVAMGHEIDVTPLQLVAAYASLVNGGVLYRPKVVQSVVNDQGQELYKLHPQPQRRVITEQTSQQMREVLTRVVAPGGTGFKAFCPEYAIGGKTGTTKKIDPATHQYSSTLYIGSFCGFAPADNPRLVCLVTVDEPQKGAGYYGGTVACPAVREVLVKGLTLLNVPPRTADEQKKAIAEAKLGESHGATAHDSVVSINEHRRD